MGKIVTVLDLSEALDDVSIGAQVYFRLGDQLFELSAPGLVKVRDAYQGQSMPDPFGEHDLIGTLIPIGQVGETILIRFEHGRIHPETMMESPRGQRCLARDVKVGQDAWDPEADIPGNYLHYGKRLS